VKDRPLVIPLQSCVCATNSQQGILRILGDGERHPPVEYAQHACKSEMTGEGGLLTNAIGQVVSRQINADLFTVVAYHHLCVANCLYKKGNGGGG